MGNNLIGAFLYLKGQRYKEFTVSGFKFQGLGSRFQVPGSRFQVTRPSGLPRLRQLAEGGVGQPQSFTW
ncbi:hypothetical protein A4D02_16965 [Niastella koreensis]|uniref:Uncharacterized protein n=1 Tax=Niastella koreensis TaxID=354356 RepID=A0ABX3NQD1_9BACT|nr:hypothetical protein A4D02_16965 [Niastella koreensis]